MAQLKDLIVNGTSRFIGPVYTNSGMVAFGTCSTAAGTAEKVVTIDDPSWTLKVGNIIGVKATASNSASNVTLNVNGTGAKSIWYNNAIYTGNSVSVCGNANRTTFYMYDGTYWVWLNCGILGGNTNTIPASYCTTAAGTAAKTASHSSYVLLAKSYTLVTIANANTSASALTLNINSKGAKPIYINGTVSSASNYTLPAGTYLVYYDGTNYYFRTDGQIISTASIADSAVTADKLASDAVTASHIETALGFKPLPVSNPNLLDNWWFGSGVINQRGVTSQSTEYKFVIDRWRIGQNSLFELKNGYVKITGSMWETCEIPDALGKTVTASVKLHDGTILSASGIVTNTGAWHSILNKPEMYVAVNSNGLIEFCIRDCEAEAVKLEYGSVSTLANDSAPDYATELLKCQRYLRPLVLTSTLVASNNFALFNREINPPMRKTPSVTPTTCQLDIFGVGGVALPIVDKIAYADSIKISFNVGGHTNRAVSCDSILWLDANL